MSWQDICAESDLVENSGICALVDGKQIAVFYLPEETPTVYALGNWDPIGEANVMSRGIVGDLNGQLVVASPLYKQHFDLTTGICLEQPDEVLPVYECRLEAGRLQIGLSRECSSAA